MQKTIHNKLLLLIGLLLITILLWNRFLRIHLPKDFIDFYLPIVVLFTLVSLVVLIINIKLIYKPSKISVISKLMIKVYDYYYLALLLNAITVISNSPQKVLDFINHSFFMKKYGKQIGYYTETVPYNLLLWRKDKSKAIFYIPTNMIPRIVVACMFLVDVFYFKHIQYFYYSLFLLTLPMIMNAIRFIITDSAKSTLKYLNAHLRFYDVDLKTLDYKVEFRDIIPDMEDAKDIITHRGNKELLEWFMFNFERYGEIANFMEDVKKKEDFYKPYENIFVYSCYLLSWLYILFFIF